MRKILQLTLALMLAATGGLMAQVTSAVLTGKITDEKGAAVPGANVVALHTPTGTNYGTVTATDGRFTIPNMRVGGPYKVTISFVGYTTQEFNDINIKLGEPLSLNPVMKEGTELQEIVVLGTEDKIMNGNRNGTLTNIGSKQILTLPTITRSINDMTRLTPQASSTSTGSIGGGNYRQNYITVDGSDFNNSFGIGSNLPAGGSPISLDALEEISVNITPYDIRQSGFIGSSINAVTRSGTNAFTGSAYTFFRNENMQGNKVANNDPLTRAKLQDNTYGFRLGGPIIKDKLFFFVNAEYGKKVSPGQLNVAATPEAAFGSSPNIARPTTTQLDDMSKYLSDEYQYSTGPYQGYDFESTNTRFVGRLDWNINSNHRFNIRYSSVESKSPSFPSTSRSPLSSFAQTRTSIYALPYKNANYYQEANFYSLAAELNSSLFDGKLANTLRGTFTHQNDPRSSDSKVFPFVDILDGSTIPEGGQGTPLTSFGYEPFTSGNLRDVKKYSIVDNLTWSSGIHNFTAGAQIDLSSTKNGFQRFATSYYTFRSWNDFVTGVKPVDFAITYSLLPNYEQAYPRFKFAQYSVYGQDEVTLFDRLKLTAGLRIDLPSYRDVKEIQTHPLVAGLTFANGETIDTGVLPENRLMWSPRVGFNWDVKGDRSIQIRGGSGIFTGQVPTVWIVAQSGDAGLIQFTQTWVTPNTKIGGVNGTNQRNDPSLYVTPGPFSADPNAYRPATQPTPGTAIGLTSAMQRNFKFPQTWKSSLAVDLKLPFGMTGTLEGIVNKDLNIAIGRNPNLVDAQPLNITGYADNRPIYPAANSLKFINPLTTAGLPVANGTATGTQAYNPVVLSNAQKGYYWSVTAKVDKQLSSNFFATVAYTKSKARVLYDGSGDQLLNTWSITQIVDNANSPEMASANYVVPDRFIASLSYRKEYLKHFATTVALFYEGSIAGRFSYTYSSDFNRDGQTNDLIYIPKDASEITFAPLTIGSGAGAVTYTAQQQSDLFFRYVEQDKYLSAHKGSYAERNGAQLPWRSQVDFRLIQDIFTNIGNRNNTIQLTLDIFNFTNLLNKDWGLVKQINNSSILVPANVSSLTVGGSTKPTFQLAQDRGVPITSTFRNNNSITSTYYMQVGIRYTF